MKCLRAGCVLCALLPPVALAQQPALLEPEDGRVYHGAQLMTFESTADPLAGYLAALGDSMIEPAVRGFFFSVPGVRGPANTLAGLGTFLAGADSIGFIPELSLFFVDSVATDSVIAATTTHDWILDSIITLCRSYGRRMFLRIGGEFNGAGPGWNGGGYHPYDYVSMFRKITGMFAAQWSRDSIATIWCYEPDAPNDFDSVDGRGPRWYPGDSYVDWFGLDVFDAAHFDQALPDSDRSGITRKGKSERFLAMARDKGKPVYMSEVSAIRVNISADSADATADWGNWFAKYWQFLDAHPEIKGYSYINANWPVSAYPEWGDARIQNSPLISQWYGQEMRRAKYIHLRSAAMAVAPGAEGAPARSLRNSAVARRAEVYDAAGRRAAVLSVTDAPGIARPLIFLPDRLGRGVRFLRTDPGPSGTKAVVTGWW